MHRSTSLILVFITLFIASEAAEARFFQRGRGDGGGLRWRWSGRARGYSVPVQRGYAIQGSCGACGSHGEGDFLPAPQPPIAFAPPSPAPQPPIAFAPPSPVPPSPPTTRAPATDAPVAPPVTPLSDAPLATMPPPTPLPTPPAADSVPPTMPPPAPLPTPADAPPPPSLPPAPAPVEIVCQPNEPDSDDKRARIARFITTHREALARGGNEALSASIARCVGLSSVGDYQLMGQGLNSAEDPVLVFAPNPNGSARRQNRVFLISPSTGAITSLDPNHYQIEILRTSATDGSRVVTLVKSKTYERTREDNPIVTAYVGARQVDRATVSPGPVQGAEPGPGQYFQIPAERRPRVPADMLNALRVWIRPGLETVLLPESGSERGTRLFSTEEDETPNIWNRR